jgi:hypothetical protein
MPPTAVLLKLAARWPKADGITVRRHERSGLSERPLVIFKTAAVVLIGASSRHIGLRGRCICVLCVYSAAGGIVGVGLLGRGEHSFPIGWVLPIEIANKYRDGSFGVLDLEISEGAVAQFDWLENAPDDEVNGWCAPVADAIRTARRRTEVFNQANQLLREEGLRWN